MRSCRRTHVCGAPARTGSIPGFSDAGCARTDNRRVDGPGLTARIVFSVLLLLPCAMRPAVSIAPSPAEPVEIVRHDTSIDVVIGGRPFTTYYFDASMAKPFFHPLRSAAGTIVTRGYPVTQNIAGEDRDEPHQRPMYFAHGDVNGFDFWGEAEFSRWSHHPVSTFGRTRLRSLDEARTGGEDGTVQAT